MPLSYLALGDSYTIGEGVEPAGRWPHQLARALRSEGIALEDPLTIAATGWTTDELDAAIDAADPPGPFALASLLAGVKNQYRRRDVDDDARGVTGLLGRSLALAGALGGRVRALSSSDGGVTPCGGASGRDRGAIARELDAYIAAAHALCQTRGVAFVDIAPVSRTRGAEPAMLADDG